MSLRHLWTITFSPTEPTHEIILRPMMAHLEIRPTKENSLVSSNLFELFFVRTTIAQTVLFHQSIKPRSADSQFTRRQGLILGLAKCVNDRELRSEEHMSEL